MTPALYFQAPRTGPLSAIIAEHLSLPASKAQELIAVGATYYQPKAELTTEHFDKETLHLRRVMNDFVVSEGDAIRAYPAPRRHSTVIDDVLSSKAFSWEDYILRESEHYVIVNKPAGLPCHASAENLVDNVLWRLKEHLDRREAPASTAEAASPTLPSEPAPLPNVGLYLPQRLDTDTSGLLLVAKSEAWISRLGKYLQEKKYRKWYKLLLCYQASPAAIQGVMNGSLPPLLGVFSPGDVLTSYLVRSDKTPKIYQWDTAGYAPEDIQDAVMKLEAIEMPIVKTSSEWDAWQQSLSRQITTTAVPGQSTASIQRLYTAAALTEWLGNTNLTTAATNTNAQHRDDLVVVQELTVELLTGRTHQIRGQFQALQRHPLIQASPFQQCQVHVAGDHMYPGASFPLELHRQPDSNWASPFLALASFRFKLDIPPPPMRVAVADPAETTSIHPNAPSLLNRKATTSKRVAKRQALKNVFIDPLDVSLPSCWWAPLSSLTGSP
jgi:23S rRNA-/tRNA-specific pseudouridylate synthase